FGKPGQLVADVVEQLVRFQDVPEEHLKFLEDLDSDLEKIELPVENSEQISNDKWPYAAAASVLGSFPPMQLRPLGKDTDSGQEIGGALHVLADDVAVGPNGQWILSDAVRRQCLIRLQNDGLLMEAIESNKHIADSRRDMLLGILQGHTQPLTGMTSEALADLQTVASWLEPLDIELPVSGTLIQTVIQRRAIIDPMRTLVGNEFQGRVDELQCLRDHISGTGPYQTILVWGPGGVGKSALVGKLLLELEDHSDNTLAFAYVDFDRSRHDLRKPRELVESILRQLRLRYATREESLVGFSALESVSAGGSMQLAAESLGIENPDLSLDELLQQMAKQLFMIRDMFHQTDTPALVLVFDTVEEIQIQGPGATEDLLALLDQFRTAIPDLRVILSGRGSMHEVTSVDHNGEIHLGDLDQSAAEGLLLALGIKTGDMRRQIIRRFGRNPLTLRLAADAFEQAGDTLATFGGIVDQAMMMADATERQIQGILYNRILGHIPDPQVAKVAHPGLVVRRVDVEVLREVLAEPCEFDPSQSEQIYQKLRRQVSLFEFDSEDQGLRHRQDVRQMMLRAMAVDPKRRGVVKKIHQRAVQHYSQKSGLRMRTEELYHRLMLNERPRSLDHLWDREMRRSLVSSWEDPFPPAARSWLGPRLGIKIDRPADQWEQEDWEAAAASQAFSWLESDKPEKALDVLRERESRIAGSELYATEMHAFIRLGDFDQAQDVFQRGMQSALEAENHAAQRSLLGANIKLCAATGDPAGIWQSANALAGIAELTGQIVYALYALTEAIEALRGIDAPQVSEAAAALSRFFRETTVEELDRHTRLVRRILHQAAAVDTPMLSTAIDRYGDRTSEDDGIFIADAFVVARLFENHVRADANPAITRLGVELGFNDDHVLEQLSRIIHVSASRSRLKDWLRIAMDHPKDEEKVRSIIANELIQPAENNPMPQMSTV
ncbi:MAG: ATP-binding protein, partial [Rhodopirellula bahusiensis]